MIKERFSNYSARASTDSLLVFVAAALNLACIWFFVYTDAYRLREQFFNADTMFFPGLYRDLFIDPYPIAGWSVAAIPSYFPDMFIYFACRFLAGSEVWAAIYFAVSQVSLFAIAHVFLFSELSPAKKPQAIAAGLLIGPALWCLVFATNGDLWITILLPNHHAGAALLCYACVILTLRFLRMSQIVKISYELPLLSILFALGFVSNKTIVLNFLLPVVATLVLFLRADYKLAVPLALASAIGLALGLWLDGYLRSLNLFVIPTIEDLGGDGFSFEALVVGSVRYYSEAMQYVFRLHSSFYLVFTVFLLAVACVYGVRSVLPRLVRKQSAIHPADFYIVYLLVSFAVVSLGIAGAHAAFGLLAARYAIGMHMLPLSLAGFLMLRISSWRWRTVCFAALAFGLAGTIAWKAHAGSAKPQDSVVPDLVRCLDENSEAYGLKAGFGNYWRAKPVTLLSEKGLIVRQITEGITPRYWINNYFWFFGKASTPPNNFIITTGLDRNLILEKFGSPRAKFSCGDDEVFVYDRPKDQEFARLFRATPEEIDLWRQLTGR